jgi:hypothetical protein
MHIIFKLLSPLKYLKIHHPQKRIVDFILPIILTTFILITFLKNNESINFIGKDGVINSINGLVQFLTGFYVAALAAIATFPNKNMDSPTDGTQLKLNSIILTRRQYLSYMFGYLALIGIFLIIFGQVMVMFKTTIYSLNNELGQMTYLIIKLFSLALYLFFVTSLLCTTLYSLYYLTEKIHETKAELTDSPVSEDEEEDKHF